MSLRLHLCVSVFFRSGSGLYDIVDKNYFVMRSDKRSIYRAEFNLILDPDQDIALCVFFYLDLDRSNCVFDIVVKNYFVMWSGKR